MKHLKRISISNARRFAKDISIDFGKGATILLAPNGTGKTTVFEAIEFALTGAVQRLNMPPLSLIRDNENGVDVRLDFDDDLFCEVQYRKGSNPILTGHHDVIFPNRNINEIPYLIRLTHLLEQRGANWFVQQSDANEAGRLLDRLSLGKELNKISSSKTSAIRAANSAIEKANNERLAVKEKLKNFDDLIVARTNAKTDFTLRSLNELIKEIINIHSIFSTLEVTIEEKLSAIISFSAQTESQLSSKIEFNSEQIIKLAKVESFIEEFNTNKQLQLANELLVKNIGEKINSDNKELEVINLAIKDKTDNNNELKIKLSSLFGLRDCFTKIEEASSQSKMVDKAVSEIKLSIPKVTEKLEVLNKQFESASSNNDKHRLLSNQLELLAKTKGELKTKQILVSEWIGIMVKKESIINTRVPFLLANEKERSEQLNQKKSEIEDLDKEFKERLDLINSLQNASDNISGAVSQIANNLSKDKGDCPVCNAKYSPEELHKRIAKAVSYIDPILNEAIGKQKIILDKLDQKKVQHDELNEQLNILRNELQNAENEIKTFEATINENMIPKFPGIKSTTEASEWIEREIANIHEEEAYLQREKSLLGNVISFEELERITTLKQIHERELEQLNEKLRAHQSKKMFLDEELFKLNEQFGNSTIDEIRSGIIEIEKSNAQLLLELDQAKQYYSRIQNVILENVKKVTIENTKSAQIKSRQNEIIAEWKEADLIGEPNFVAFTQKKEYLRQEKLKLSKAKNNLKTVDEEIAKWKIAEEYEKFDSDIKTLCGSLSEHEYLDKLSTLSKQSEDHYNVIDEKRKTLNTLYSKIGVELESAHGIIKEINPRWNALLSRVVINPRFAETSLNSYNLRNRPQAEVNLNMHGLATKVSELASEAQMTDLQLTFMLAMANNYEWTPWRGLLLDDPTQHHDLVHSASVFDLLRDYILYNDYQILLGTHDAVHANFFKRKLENDNIPVKIWSLTTGSDGVKAVCMD